MVLPLLLFIILHLNTVPPSDSHHLHWGGVRSNGVRSAKSPILLLIQCNDESLCICIINSVSPTSWHRSRDIKLGKILQILEERTDCIWREGARLKVCRGSSHHNISRPNLEFSWTKNFHSYVSRGQKGFIPGSVYIINSRGWQNVVTEKTRSRPNSDPQLGCRQLWALYPNKHRGTKVNSKLKF